MIAVTLQRQKCIGCNYCQELCPELFRMSKKDGKSVLLKGVDKKGFSTVRVNDILADSIKTATEACPVKIISFREI
ncbi:MAG: ferredoxin [Crocinitomicaceae bacterium]|nr:ferredoxin [Crocinitomicaceae bacterium]MBK8927756.1 ferredoxin [Crocinitomicaceae bacterium]